MTVPEQDKVAGPTAPTEESRRWFFARAMLDDRTLELQVDGAEVEIERKPFEVLRFLLQHAGEVVTKDELLAGVWPGRFLSDTVLTKCIGRLREALGDEDQSVIKTVYGYGYRLMAPVRVEIQRVEPAARFDFKPGDRPPARPLWSLIRRLGAGGHGEAWLGQHDKTHEQRVFKFAVDTPSLAALKREITLYRLLNDSLGERARIVDLLDWNLEHQPYFIESRYVAGGSLVEWAERHGKLANIPLALRLDVAAQIAEALAIVHSVGVLHKDLKPSNVLVEEVAGAAPAIRLADFGSGGLLDPKRLEQMGITRLGFTRTIAAGEGTTGTPLYFAPEVLTGQPPTVKADIYALGVMLYQLVVGDFHTAMSPGWERDIGDELLRECIADAAQGEPERRLADAAELAQRLRTLEQRREERRREREAKEKAEAAALALERLKARRFGLAIAFGVLIAGLVVSTLLYLDARRARERAESASRRAQGVSEFISHDMLTALTSGNTPVKDLTVRQLLDSASSEVDRRFAGEPETMAAVHAALGRSYLALEADDLAAAHLSRALNYFADRDIDETTLKLAAEALPLTYAMGTIRREIGRFDSLLQAGIAKYGPTDPRVLPLRIDVARGWLFLGQWLHAATELRALLDTGAGDRALRAQAELVLGHVLAEDLDELPEARRRLQHVIDEFSALPGPHQLDLARARLWLGHALGASGEFAAADAQLSAAEKIIHDWVGEKSGYVSTLRLFRAEWLIEQQSESAIAVLEQPTAFNAATGYSGAIDESWYFREQLAIAYSQAGRTADAERAMRQALASVDEAEGPEHPAARRIRIGLADILRARGTTADAWALVRPQGREIDLTDLPTDHPINGELSRVAALLLESEGKTAEARAKLDRAAQIFASRYGEHNWRARRARQELHDLPSG